MESGDRLSPSLRWVRLELEAALREPRFQAAAVPGRIQETVESFGFQRGADR